MKKSSPKDGSSLSNAKRRRTRILGGPEPVAISSESDNTERPSAAITYKSNQPQNDASSSSSSRKRKKRSSSSPLSSQEQQKQSARAALHHETSRTTYPNPNTFAERLMKVLETKAALDAIWWEHDGKTVALDVERLKRGPVLQDLFGGIQYKFFIRNFSRGFRRITDLSVPCGLFFYQNSLFQSDRPHLVRMMRMDSEIQNIFAEHENTSHWQSNNNDTNTAAKGSQPGIVSQPPENSDSVEVPSHHPFQPQIAQQPQLPHNLDPVLLQNILRLASNPTAGNPNASTPGSSDGLGEQPTPPPPAQDGIFSDLIAQLMMQQQQQQQQQQAQSQNEYPDPDANKVARDLLLHQIVRLAGEYLSQEASSSQTSPHESTIRATLMLIQQLGHQYLLQVQQQQRRGSSIADVPFLQQLVGTLINHSSSSAVTSSLISGGQHQQQQQQQQGDQGGAPADPAFISLLLQNLSSMAGSQPAPGMVDSATIAPPLPGLLGGIIQQFQQQQPQAPIHQQLPSDVSRATGEQQQALQQLLAGLHHLQRQQQQGDSLTGPSSNNA